MSDFEADLINTVDRIAEGRCDKAVRDAAETGEWPQDLWAALEEAGLPAATVPEAAGGPGLDFSDAMAVLRRCAYHALPVPLAETLAAGRLLAAAGLAMPEGPVTVAAGQGAPLVLSASGPQARLSGTAARVPWGDVCPAAVVAAEADGDAMLAVVALGAAREQGGEERNLAGEPRVTLSFEAAPVLAFAPLAGAARRLELEGALCRSVQMAGALERALEHAVRYAGERVTFGRPIAKFQAVQQMLAVLAGHVAAASAAADMAVEASVEVPDAFTIAVAKARTGEAAGRSAEIAHQVHGAMGFTHEHALHYATRRLWSWRDEFGAETRWQTELGLLAAAAGPRALWPMLTRTAQA